jgi:hypothetical protein
MIFDKAERHAQGRRNILSIDGGGMRGTICIAMLAELEQQSGVSVHEMFDMVAGTSTGAIMSAGIALGLTAEQMLDEIYKDKLPRAFQSGWGSTLRFIFSGLRYRYRWQPFVDILSAYDDDYRIRDLTDTIVLFTVKDVRTSNTYYVVNKGPGAPAFADWTLRGAVAASGSSPTYFPAVLGNFIDGGVGKDGNPCLAAATEAMHYIGDTEGFIPGKVTMVALGTGYVSNAYADGDAGRFNIFKWVPYMIIEGIDDAALQQSMITRTVFKESVDFRRYNPLLTREALRELDVDPGTIDPPTLTLDTTGAAEIELMARIGRAYARAIDWQQGDVMPWDTTGGRGKPELNAAADWRNFP